MPDDPARGLLPSRSVPALVVRLQALAQRHEPTVHGRRVCWRQFGDGPPLVLLHGGHGSWLHWVRNIEALAACFTLWVADMPGYGDSDDVGPGGMQALLDATLGSLNALVGPDAPIDIAGFSFGGLVAAQVAARRQAVRRLTLLGPAGHGAMRRPTGKLVNWQQAAHEGDANALAAAMRHNLGVHMLHEAASIDELALYVHTGSCLRTRFRSRTISRAGGLADALARHPGETMLLWGEHDVTAEPARLVRDLCAGQPNRRGQLIEGAGHWAQYERADAVNRLLLGTAP
jgi:pimeloyl-ACP methyl ester carboxylesterase